MKFIKKISLVTSLFFMFLLLPIFFAKQAEAADLCCPPGYGDGGWNCPYHVNRDHYCCRRTSILFSYEVVPKFICGSEPSITSIAHHELSSDVLQGLNPLSFLGASEELHTDGKLNIAGLINRALTIIFPLAGLALFLMLVIGGFQMLTGAASKQNLDSGKQRVTAAIIGFLLLFSSYWIVQIVEQITGVGILG